jgi:hypothetical protein
MPTTLRALTQMAFCSTITGLREGSGRKTKRKRVQKATMEAPAMIMVIVTCDELAKRNYLIVVIFNAAAQKFVANYDLG